MNDENIELLNFETWDHIFRNNDEEAYKYEMEALQDAYADLSSEEMREGSNNKRRENEPGPQDIYLDKNKQSEFNLFGYHIHKIDVFWKNVIGLTLILAVFGVLAYGMKMLKDLNTKFKKDKKQKKK